MGAHVVGFVLPEHQSLVSLGSRSSVVSSMTNCDGDGDSDSDGQLDLLGSVS